MAKNRTRDTDQEIKLLCKRIEMISEEKRK